MKGRFNLFLSPAIGLLLLTALLAGCTSTKIDWAPRVGTYTYDQAVLELGPPDKYAKLQDGTMVAEWLTHRGRYYSYPHFTYSYSPWYYGPYYPSYIESSSPDHFLRLTFGPDGLLRAWKKFYK